MLMSSVAISNLSGAGMSQLAASGAPKTWLEHRPAALIKGANASPMPVVGAALRKMSESVAPSQKASGASDAV